MAQYVFHHLHLLSPDPMAAGRFYQTMFYAEIMESKGANGLPRCNMTINGQTILISTADDRIEGSPAAGPHSSLGLDHFGLAVDDMDGAAAELRARGAEFTLEPRTHGKVTIAFVRAPDGVSVELVQYQ